MSEASAWTGPEMNGEFASFGEAAEAVMRMMNALLELDLWLVTRVYDQEWIVLHAFGEGELKPGDVLPLNATICAQMLAGAGPNVAPDVAAVPAYADSPIAKGHAIEAYAGAPLIVGGAVYGVLCGISATAIQEELAEQTPHLVTAARALSTILSQQLRGEALVRRAERAESEALVDELTGLHNRRGWEQLVALEEARGRRYGHKYAVFFMDLDGLKTINDTHGHAAGDEAIARAADAIRSATREHDVAARVGGDEFALLAVETDAAEAAALGKRLADAFRAAGVAVSIGVARSDSPADVTGTTRRADREMYRRKGEAHSPVRG